MNVFLAFGYHDRDSWIRNLIVPVVRAFGDEPLVGDVLYGDTLSEGVREQLDSAHAISGFLTRRTDHDGNLTDSTHWWVLQELAIGVARDLLVLPVREEGVDTQQGIAGAHQWIEYKPSERDRCLVEIVTALGRWHSDATIRLQVLPEDCAAELRPLLRAPDLRVWYQLLIGGDEKEPTRTKLVPIKGGLFVTVRGVPRDALVQLRVEAQGKLWTSDYESLDSIGVHLAKE
jgi:hypothetical protein